MTVVRGISDVIPVTYTTVAEAYTAGDQVGTLTEIPNALIDPSCSVALLSLSVLDKASQSVDLDVLFFNDEVTVASGNNDAVSITDAEMAEHYLGKVSIQSSDYTALAANSEATINGIGLLLQGAKKKSRSLYFLVVTRGAPTFVGTSDLVFKFGLCKE